MLRHEPASHIRVAGFADKRRAGSGSALVECGGERVELVRRGAPGPEHLVELQELVVREYGQLGSPPKVVGELSVATLCGEVGLEP
jgi:hypothetical protein